MAGLWAVLVPATAWHIFSCSYALLLFPLCIRMRNEAPLPFMINATHTTNAQDSRDSGTLRSDINSALKGAS